MLEEMGVKITPENAWQYEGRILNTYQMRCHNYPLLVVFQPEYGQELGWMTIDRFGVCMAIPVTGIEFDFMDIP